ncbi:hypothetical protein CsSME_00050193 [Camellia sinensis var. sinensis]
MLMVGDFNLNSMQGCTDSVKDILKQTMVSQEVMFRKQVHELHHLYRIQKSLMEDFGWKELDDGYNLWKASTQSTLGPFVNPIQYSPLAKEKNFCRSPMVSSTQFENRGFLEDNHSDYCSLQQRSFDFHFPADKYVNRVDKDFSDKGNGWNLKTPIALSHWFHNENASSLEELNLTLSIGGSNRIKDGHKRTWYEKLIHFSPRHVIDLEESTDVVSNEDAKSVSSFSHAALITGDKHDSRISVQSNQVSTNSVKKDLSHGVTVNCSLIDGSESYEEQNSFNQGFGDIKCNDMFTKGKSAAPYEALDLNKIHVDESAIEPCPIDLEPVSGPLSEICEDFGSDHRNSGNGNIDLLLKFPKGNYTDLTTAEVNEDCEEELVFSHPHRNGNTVEDGNSNKSSTSCESDCIVDDSSSGAKTMQSGTDLGGSNISTLNHFSESQSSQVAETQSGEQDLRYSDNSELKHQCCNKKEESAGEDVLIQNAAEVLICFSFGSSMRNQDCGTKEGSRSNEIENEGRDRPQYSLDSYESIVLKLPESSVDDYCVSSKPFEVDELDNKDCRSKLRRGRRLKDFQRDVLPGLASLSEHEICEDINIMETVIRSREYKRMRSKMAGGGKWFAPVRSRRSRLNYVGLRYYS